jgi:hypothetical protein
MKKLFKMLAAAGLVAASVSVSQAQPYYLTGDFNVWNNSGNSLYELAGGPNTYTYVITGGTPGSYENLKVIPTAGQWSPTYPGNNLQIKYDAGGSNTMYFYSGTIVDGWAPVQNRVGYADPGSMAWELTGDFTSPTWGSDPNAQLVSAGNGVYTNTYLIATAGTYNFKFRTPGTWGEVNFGNDFGNGGGNATITTTNANQKVLFQLDLPNGRWLAGNLAPGPITNQVVFAVDMSSQIQLGQFTPGSSVFVAGAFNSWPGPPGGLVLTNDPPYNGSSNTNIYYGTNTFVGLPNSVASGYKFTDNDPAAANGGWEQSSDRTLTLLSTSGTLLLPVVSFNNAYASDYLTTDTIVTFTVDMNGAHTAAGLSPAISPAVNFDANTMPAPYMSGNFLDAGWATTWIPPHLQAMTETVAGSRIYTYTYTVKAGHPVEVHYKYGFDDGTDSIDNEAPSGQDHVRIIRTPAYGSYAMPVDTYGNQHVEPNFGQLTVSPATGGNVLVKWLGRPGVYLQNNSGLTGSWTNHTGTDGNVWTGMTNSTSDGLATVTNLPAGGSAGFFRLVKPN